MAQRQSIRRREAVTTAEYGAFQRAFDYFNVALFDNGLPHVLVTLQRHAGAYGYFSPERFGGRLENAAVHELALNPDMFEGRSDKEILSTLVHEMAHVWRQGQGNPPRQAYHCKSWAAKMKEIGLYPSSTGAFGGAETGQTVSHYIVEGGPFVRAYEQLAAQGFALAWQSRPVGRGEAGKKASKTKYTCPDCGQNAWAKPDAELICGVCYAAQSELVVMQAEQQ